MKKTMRFLQTALISLLSLCLCTFGVSFDVGAASINIHNASGSSISIAGNTYYAYKVFAVSASSDGGSYSYTVDGNCLGTDADYKAYGGYNLAELKALDSGSEAAIRSFANGLYDHYIKAALAGGDGSLKAIHGYAGFAAGAADAGSGETATIAGLSDGYYLVVGTATPKDFNSNGVGSPEGSTTKVVSLSMLDTATDISGGTPTIEVKASAPKFDGLGKAVGEIKRNTNDNLITETVYSVVADGQIGEDVPYMISFTLPDLTGYSGYYLSVTDIFDEGLTYHGGLEVTAGGETLSKVDTVSYTTLGYVASEGTSGGKKTLCIQFNKPLDLSGKLVTIKYNAFMNDKAKWADDESDDTLANYNTAKITYSSDPYNPSSTSDSVDVKAATYTYAVNIEKTNADGSTKLKGAEFTLEPKESNGVKMQFVSVSTPNDVPTFRVATPDEITDSSVTKTQILTSGSSADTFRIIGLDGGRKYKLVETKAPDGYSLLGDSLDFTITATYNGMEINTLSIGGSSGEIESGLVEFSNTPLNAKVRNQAGGSKLMNTGGIGTTVFYVTGGILMAGALVLLVTKLRMRNREE